MSELVRAIARCFKAGLSVKDVAWVFEMSERGIEAVLREAMLEEKEAR